MCMISDQIRFICSVSLIVISAFGIPINILPCFILLRKKSRNIFHNLLLILNISDTVCIYFQNISFWIINYWIKSTYNSYILSTWQGRQILSKLLRTPLTTIFFPIFSLFSLVAFGFSS